MMPPPLLKLYEPPLDDDEDEDDFSDVSRIASEDTYATFALCLLIGVPIAAAIWFAAAAFVP